MTNGRQNHVTPQMYSVLDRLIDEAVAELPPYPANISVANAKAFAAEQLGKIDCLLLSHGFVYPGKGLVQSLSDGLEPIIHAIPQALIDDLTPISHPAITRVRS